jgi:hypothetical protein
VGRSPRAYLAFFATLGLSGCLLFTDPINKAPVVIIDPHSDPVILDKPTQFTATVTDDKDSPASFMLEWAEFNNQLKCDWITPATWVSSDKSTSLDYSQPYPFKATSMASVCLCARATDHNGATDLKCVLITPANPTPVANIKDVTYGDPSGPPNRPLCSLMHLSAEDSTFTPGDTPADQFQWGIAYTGSDSSLKQVQFATCAGIDASKAYLPYLHRCFYAGSPGTYAVTLSITDSFVQNGATISAPSNLATFEIPVDVDTPACLQRTDPEVGSRLILLGGTYLSRTISVLGVKDDCQPYPPIPSPPLQFFWSVLDTQASPSWTYQAGNSDTFTLSVSMFPNARPGDTIKLRVEVRDTSVQTLYSYGGQTLPLDMDTCCGSYPCGTCSPTNNCIRWTTWTVQFQP